MPVLRSKGKSDIYVYTVEPQSYGPHSYGILGQPDTDIKCIFAKYHQNFYKMGTGHQF